MRRALRILMLAGAAVLCAAAGSGAPDACCFPDGFCLDMDELACLAASGTSAGSGSECASTLCTPSRGACCTASPFGPTCGETDRLSCGAGAFLGYGTTCVSGACTEEHVCCLPDGACVAALPLACVAAGGAPRAAGSCAPDICYPTEACCLSDGTACFDLAVGEDCSLAGGVSAGPGSSCALGSCALATVACCSSDGSCADRDLYACYTSGGSSEGIGSDCASTSCPDTIGACCAPTPFGLACIEVDAAECAARSGSFLGTDRACAGLSCSAIVACCLATGGCADETAPECELAGGDPQGPGSSCSSMVCVSEACCLPDGGCAEAAPDVCVTVGGTPQGPTTECLTASCARPGVVPNGTAARPGAPLLMVKAAVAPDLALDWSPSCSASASDYAVYEGTIGGWYSHADLLCGTLGALTSATLTPGTGDRYYLIVPLTDADEGSYGQDALDVERPPGSPTTCRPSQLLGCP